MPTEAPVVTTRVADGTFCNCRLAGANFDTGSYSNPFINAARISSRAFFIVIGYQ